MSGRIYCSVCGATLPHLNAACQNCLPRGVKSPAPQAMTDLTNAELSDFLFNAIAHGDDKHRQWLRDKCDEIATQIAARRLAAPPNEDETVKAEPVLDHRGHLIGWRRTEQEPILSSYRKRPAQQDAFPVDVAEIVRIYQRDSPNNLKRAVEGLLDRHRQAFAAELVRWIQNKSPLAPVENRGALFLCEGGEKFGVHCYWCEEVGRRLAREYEQERK